MFLRPTSGRLTMTLQVDGKEAGLAACILASTCPHPFDRKTEVYFNFSGRLGVRKYG